MYDQLKEAIKTLSSMCDGAKNKDNIGFTQYDAFEGKKLAKKEKWDFEDADKAFHIVQKYSKQINIEGIPKPTRQFSMEEIQKFDWTTAKFIEKLGKWVRDCNPIPRGFYDYWKANHDELYAKGISITKFDGKWKVSYWTDQKPLEKPCGICGAPRDQCCC